MTFKYFITEYLILQVIVLLYAIFTLLSGIVFLSGINSVSTHAFVCILITHSLFVLPVRSFQNDLDADIENVLRNCLDRTSDFAGNRKYLFGYFFCDSDFHGSLHTPVHLQLLR